MAVAAIQAKHNNKMFSLQEMIKKSLFLSESPSATPSLNSNTTPIALSGGDSLLKTITERWN